MKVVEVVEVMVEVETWVYIYKGETVFSRNVVGQSS